MDGEGRLSFLGRPLPPAFELLVVTLPPGHDRPLAPAEWRDALVVVERGTVELVRARGERLRFSGGAVIALAGLPLRALRGVGRETAVLAVVRRRGQASSPSRSAPARLGRGGNRGISVAWNAW